MARKSTANLSVGACPSSGRTINQSINVTSPPQGQRHAEPTRGSKGQGFTKAPKNRSPGLAQHCSESQKHANRHRKHESQKPNTAPKSGSLASLTHAARTCGLGYQSLLSHTTHKPTRCANRVLRTRAKHTKHTTHCPTRACPDQGGRPPKPQV